MQIIGEENPLASFFVTVVMPLCDVRLTSAQQSGLFVKGLLGALTHLEHQCAMNKFIAVFDFSGFRGVHIQVDDIFQFSGLNDYNKLIKEVSRYDLKGESTQIKLKVLLTLIQSRRPDILEEFQALLAKHTQDPWYGFLKEVANFLFEISASRDVRVIAFTAFWIKYHTQFSATKAHQLSLLFINQLNPFESLCNRKEVRERAEHLESKIRTFLGEIQNSCHREP